MIGTTSFRREIEIHSERLYYGRDPVGNAPIGEDVVDQLLPVALLDTGSGQPVVPLRLEISAISERKHFESNVGIHLLKYTSLASSQLKTPFMSLDQGVVGTPALIVDRRELPAHSLELRDLALEQHPLLEESLVL